MPIAAQSVEPTEEIRQEWQEAARSFADNQQIDDAPNSCGTSSNVQDTPPSSTPDDSPMQPSTSDEISPAEGSRDVPVTATVEHVEQAAKTVLQPSSRSPKRKPRRPRALTKSQIVAAQIMRQRDKDAAAQREKEQHERNEVRMAEQQARMERQARQRERERLQEAVREAMRGVAHAKEELKKKTIEADQARKERRRAADQLKIVPGEENEKVLDDACKDSAKVEMEEQRALDDVNAAQARLIDLRGQLNAFQMR